MAGGVDFKWFQDQQQGIQLLATQNAKRANREGLPNHDTPRGFAVVQSIAPCVMSWKPRVWACF